MNRDEISSIVKMSIAEETGYGGEITDDHIASDIDGWDSIAHIRIMYRIDLSIREEIDLRETYSARNIGELIDIFYNNQKE